MDATYRFRFLLYLAAFMLFMSVCFVYAEPLPSQNRLLFQVAPQHSSFLASTSQNPTFDPDALRATTPQVPSEVLQRLEAASPPHHRLFQRARHTVNRPLLPKAQSEFVVFDGVGDPRVSAHSTR